MICRLWVRGIYTIQGASDSDGLKWRLRYGGKERYYFTGVFNWLGPLLTAVPDPGLLSPRLFGKYLDKPG